MILNYGCYAVAAAFVITMATDKSYGIRGMIEMVTMVIWNLFNISKLEFRVFDE